MLPLLPLPLLLPLQDIVDVPVGLRFDQRSGASVLGLLLRSLLRSPLRSQQEPRVRLCGAGALRRRRGRRARPRSGGCGRVVALALPARACPRARVGARARSCERLAVRERDGRGADRARRGLRQRRRQGLRGSYFLALLLCLGLGLCEQSGHCSLCSFEDGTPIYIGQVAQMRKDLHLLLRLGERADRGRRVLGVEALDALQ